MKVIILCGGKGTRLREETEFKPKPMVLVGNKPILWHIMKIYAHWGFNDFILALGYKAEYIKDYFLNQKAFTSDFTLETKTCRKKFYLENRTEVDDFRITFVDTGLETQVGERILKCQKYIPAQDKTFMVTYGDGVADINLKKLLSFHHRQKTLGTITGVNPLFRWGLAQVDSKNRVTEFVEKPLLEGCINGGFMVFNRRGFDQYFLPGEMEHPGFRRLADKRQLSVFKHPGFWFCMDTYKDLEVLQNIWEKPNPPWKIWAEKKKASS